MRRGSAPGHRTLAPILVAGLCLFAGCSGLAGDAGRPTYGVPGTPTMEDTTPTETGGAAGSGGPTAENGSAGQGSEPRYLDLRPNCERPPSLVVAIQVGAVRNDGPDHRGLWAAYRFHTPGYRWALGPFPQFVRLMEANFRPLLEAETASYGTVERSNGTATVPVTVGTPDGDETNYRWHLERQTEGEYEGCWMTIAIRNASRSSSTSPLHGASTATSAGDRRHRATEAISGPVPNNIQRW